MMSDGVVRLSCEFRLSDVLMMLVDEFEMIETGFHALLRGTGSSSSSLMARYDIFLAAANE